MNGHNISMIIWNSILSLVLFGFIMVYFIDSDIEKIQEEEIDCIHTDINSIKFAMEYRPDTVVININQTFTK